MAHFRFRGLLGASLALLALSLGCLDPKSDGGAITGTTLIAFDTADQATSRILMWDNLDVAVEQTGTLKPTRTLRDDKLNQVKDLAWGGLCIDATGHYLYAVSSTGEVLRISNIHRQDGTIKDLEDIHVFRIEGERLSQGTFEQAALDPVNRVLYVLETNNSQSRVWAVSGPESVRASSAQGRKVEVEGGADKGGTGLAVRNGNLYAFFKEGATVYNPQKVSFEGARLRLASGGSGFPQSSAVLIGSKTTLGIYGALAIDDQERIYFARHLTGAAQTGSPLLVFRRSQFDVGYDQAPSDSLGATALVNLRSITHAGTKDWLAGLDMVGTDAGSSIHVWKNVSLKGLHKTLDAGTGTKIKGIALDGSR